MQASGAALARYEQIEDADHVLVHVCAPIVPGSDVNGSGLEVVELSAVESAATAPHTGPFAEISSSCQHLAQWIEGQGQVNAGQPREVYLDSADAADSWQIELQEPITSR